VIDTHSLQQAKRAATATAGMLGRELVEHGPTTEMFTNPEDGRTEREVTGE
jgi:phosphate transport system ATP-binding protein